LASEAAAEPVSPEPGPVPPELDLVSPEPERLLLIGWFRLLVLELATFGVFGVYWHVRRARELTKLGAARGPLAIAASLVVVLAAAEWLQYWAVLAWPPLALTRDQDQLQVGVTMLLTVGVSLTYARALRQLGARCPGMSSALLGEFYLEWRLWFLPAIQKRRWAPADRWLAAQVGALTLLLFGVGKAIEALQVPMRHAGVAAGQAAPRGFGGYGPRTGGDPLDR